MKKVNLPHPKIHISTEGTVKGRHNIFNIEQLKMGVDRP
jgi:hypothetical protein